MRIKKTKRNFEKKLNLNKLRIARLGDEAAGSIRAGVVGLVTISANIVDGVCEPPLDSPGSTKGCAPKPTGTPFC